MDLTGKILIIDDDKMTLDFFDIMLSKLGFTVIKGACGEDAFKMLEEHKPDLILLDNKLPDITGIEITQKIKKQPKYKEFNKIPIIMFSALDDPKFKVAGFEMGIDDYITKPFNFTEVLARIRSILKNRSLQNELLYHERHVAILESLNANLISFTKHIKKPLQRLYDDIKKIDIKNENQIKNFINKFKKDFNEVQAMLKGLEDEIIEIKKNGDNRNNKKQDFNLDQLETKIKKHIKKMNKIKSK
jgi:DNA-binding response OmpR family regulator